MSSNALLTSSCFALVRWFASSFLFDVNHGTFDISFEKDRNEFVRLRLKFSFRFEFHGEGDETRSNFPPLSGPRPRGFDRYLWAMHSISLQENDRILSRGSIFPILSGRARRPSSSVISLTEGSLDPLEMRVGGVAPPCGRDSISNRRWCGFSRSTCLHLRSDLCENACMTSIHATPPPTFPTSHRARQNHAPKLCVCVIEWV